MARRPSYRVQLACAALCTMASVARAQFTFTNQTSMSGTWSSGSGAVITGTAFAQPTNFSFDVPENTGISYSFTDNGYFEEAQYRFVANGSQPRCVKAIMIFQHGTYQFQPNGSITTSPWPQDGRIQVEDPCAAQTSIITYYNEPALFQGFQISIDVNHNAWMLQLTAFDGSLLPRLYLKYRPPSMNPTQILSSNGSTQAVSLPGVVGEKRHLTPLPLDD